MRYFDANGKEVTWRDIDGSGLTPVTGDDGNDYLIFHQGSQMSDELFEQRRAMKQEIVRGAVNSLLELMGNPAGASIKLDDERFIVVGTKEEITQLLGDGE